MITLPLICFCGLSYPATVSIEGPSKVMPGASFTIDVVIQNIGSLLDLDFWSLGLRLVPQELYKNVGFADVDLTTSDPDYVFSENSFFYSISMSASGLEIKSDDLALMAPVAIDAAVGSLLVRVQIDAAAAEDGESYAVELLGMSWSFFGDTSQNIETIDLEGPYAFQVTSQGAAMPWISLLLLDH
jgi:hypothetical protein